jgi:hypothetical protein
MTPAADPVDADPDPHIVLGIVGDPGAAFSLARELADAELHCELDRQLPGARWCVEVMEHRLSAASGDRRPDRESRAENAA